jgi:DNA-binding NarL/FixJ family response regulator
MRIFVISAYPTIRAGLRALVREQPGWSVVGEASPAALASGATPGGDAAPDQVDVVLADLDTRLDAETLRALLATTQPRLGLVAIGIPAGAPETQEALAVATGATAPSGLGFGVLPRDATAEEIIAAVGAVAGGLIVLDQRSAQGLLAAAVGVAPSRRPAMPPPTGAAEADTPGDPLTSREVEVLQLLAEGLANKTIAARLRVSEHTVKFHVASIMTKLSAASRTEAVTQAARRGLLIL